MRFWLHAILYIYCPLYSVLLTVFRNASTDTLVNNFRDGYRRIPGVSETFLGRASWNLAVESLYNSTGMVPASLALYSPQNGLPEDPVRVRQHAFIIYSASEYPFFVMHLYINVLLVHTAYNSNRVIRNQGAHLMLAMSNPGTCFKGFVCLSHSSFPQT